MSSPKYGLKAKLFHARYGYGRDKRFLDNAYVLPADEAGLFEVHAPSGAIHMLREGDELAHPTGTLGPLHYDKRHACVFLGAYSLPLGQVTPGWQAKPTGNSRVYLVGPNDNRHQGFSITLGEAIRPQPGVPESCLGQKPYLDNHGTIQMGISVKPMRKEYELNLIVMDERKQNGYLAYFNVLEPGSQRNRRDGTAGVFFPATEAGRPAAFCESAPDDGQVYRTAIFWPTRNNRYVTGQYRELEKAVVEKRLYKEIERMRALMSEMGESPEALGLDLAGEEARLSTLNNDWSSELFTVASGHTFLFSGAKPGTQRRHPAPQI